MARSKKGKLASKKLAIEQMKKTITDKFERANATVRKELFERLEEWAYNELGETQRELFLEALYGAEITQDIQITIALERALERINK